MKRRYLAFLIAMLLPALLVLIFLPAEVWARAGGGGSFGGGGGGGGGGFGGSGGGGGGGDLVIFLFYLCVRRPLIGVPIVVGVIVLMYFGGNSAKQGYIHRTIRRGRQAQHDHDKSAALAALTARDPDFDERQLLNRVSSAFLMIQDAWSRQNLTPVRAFISDGIHERFTIYIEMQKADRIRNQMDEVRIDNAHVVGIFSDDQFDTIHVAFHASAKDYNVNLDTGRRVRDTTHSGPFVEYWSFHRRIGVHTSSRAGSFEGNCPHCAAPLEIVDQAKCQACGSTVNSGEHDWVLAEITQESEWKVPAESQHIPGLQELKTADPGFSSQHIEDRVSVMFWRLIAADFFDDIGYATPIVSKQVAPGQKREFLVRSAMGEFWRDAAVGTVEIIKVEPGSRGDMDRIRVMVRWSGILCRRKSKGEHQVVRDKSIYTHVYVLVRKQGVKSHADRAFSSASCNQCGAPIAVSKEASCGFCGTILADGGYDWVLDSMEPYTASLAYGDLRPGEDRLAERGDSAGDGPFAKELSLAVLARMMHLDGEIDERERKALMKIGIKRNLSPAQVETAINTAIDKNVKIPVPSNHREGRDYLIQLVRAGLADGKICGKEQKVLMRMGDRFGMSAADVRMAIARERRREFQQARRSLKSQRQERRHQK